MAEILVIGATGPTGQELLKTARQGQVSLRCLARNPAKLADSGMETVKGDVLNPASLSEAMQGIRTVVSVLGTPLILKGPVTVLSEGTKNVIEAMKTCGISRFICITGMGAGDSRGHGGFVYDRVILPLLLGRIYADKDRQEEVIRKSGLDWTIIRPAFLTNKPGTGHWREITDWSGQANMTSISRADVAEFIMRLALNSSHIRQTVNLSQ